MMVAWEGYASSLGVCCWRDTWRACWRWFGRPKIALGPLARTQWACPLLRFLKHYIHDLLPSLGRLVTRHTDPYLAVNYSPQHQHDYHKSAEVFLLIHSRHVRVHARHHQRGHQEVLEATKGTPWPLRKSSGPRRHPKVLELVYCRISLKEVQFGGTCL